MLIETTISIQKKAFQRLCRASITLRRPRRLIISWLLKRLADERDISPVPWSRLRYQERDKEKNWEDTHLYLTPAEYELFLDLKKVYKMSGSFLIALAIEKYYVELLQTRGKIADNYRFTNYGLSLRIIRNIMCWTHYWGIPPHIPCPTPAAARPAP